MNVDTDADTWQVRQPFDERDDVAVGHPVTG
jgi:hypothetical protein